MQSLAAEYAENVQKICKKYAKNMPKICQKYANKYAAGLTNMKQVQYAEYPKQR